MCKAMVGRGNLEPTFYSPQNDSDDMSDIINEDKKYGTFQPINGEYFTAEQLKLGSSSGGYAGHPPGPWSNVVSIPARS